MKEKLQQLFDCRNLDGLCYDQDLDDYIRPDIMAIWRDSNGNSGYFFLGSCGWYGLLDELNMVRKEFTDVNKATIQTYWQTIQLETEGKEIVFLRTFKTGITRFFIWLHRNFQNLEARQREYQKVVSEAEKRNIELWEAIDLIFPHVNRTNEYDPTGWFESGLLGVAYHLKSEKEITPEELFEYYERLL
ncbi:MAG TPA: hypothetical protein PK466_14010 [Thermotogota bacterium]|nr:hypothetical protein [Saccharofermentans sp.]HPR97441.1 hypothetical protein [Thermotogota bacterium]